MMLPILISVSVAPGLYFFCVAPSVMIEADHRDGSKGDPLTPTTLHIGPTYPRLGRFCFRATRRISTWLMTLANFHANDSNVTVSHTAAIRAKLARGETVYFAGLGLPGMPDPGVALVEVTQTHGPRLIVSCSEPRLSGDRQNMPYPHLSLEAMREALRAIGKDVADIDAWLTTWDYPDLLGTLVRSVVEDFPHGVQILWQTHSVSFDGRRVAQMASMPTLLRNQFGLTKSVPLLMMPNHDNQAWFAFASSAFGDDEPIAIAVLDTAGDLGSISTYKAERGAMTKLFCNDRLVNTAHDPDALISIVDDLLRMTGTDRLVLCGAVALNAEFTERLRGHFKADWFARKQNRDATLQLSIPEPGVTIGAALLFAHLVGVTRA